MLLLTAVFGPVGLLVFGLTTEYHQHWVAPLIGEFLVNFGAVVAGNITYTYITDSYLERADAALVVLNGLKNLTAFAVVYAVVPWNIQSGFAVSFGALSAILFTFHLPMLLLYFKGEAIREWQGKKFTTGRKAEHGEGLE